MIYILHNDPKKTAEMLDDDSLETTIKDIAEVLTMIISREYNTTYGRLVKLNKSLELWTNWGSICEANYLYLAELGASCLAEHAFRTGGKRNYKYAEALLWARDNVPDLPHGWPRHVSHDTYIHTPFPLVMPKKYQIKGFGFEGCPNGREIQSYRNYYEAKLRQKQCKACKEEGYGNNCNNKIKFTNRSKPDWLNI